MVFSLDIHLLETGASPWERGFEKCLVWPFPSDTLKGTYCACRNVSGLELKSVIPTQTGTPPANDRDIHFSN